MSSRRQDWCKHYRAMSNATCHAGVEFASLNGISFDARPCFSRQCLGCDRAEYRTPEEIVAEEAEMEARIQSLGKARQAIVAHLGGPWKPGTPGASGRIDCPACGAASALRFSRAGYNGHIHAACATAGCVRWME